MLCLASTFSRLTYTLGLRKDSLDSLKLAEEDLLSGNPRRKEVKINAREIAVVHRVAIDA